MSRAARPRRAASGATQGAPPLKEVLDRAMQHQRGGDLQRAEAGYREIAAKDPNHLVALHLLGALLLQTEREEEAARVLEDAVARAPDQAILFANLGEAYRRLGNLLRARTNLSRALVLKSDLAEAHYTLGMTFYAEARLESAVESYERALARKPGLADAWNQIGIIRREQGRIDDALAAFRRALEVQPDHRVAHSNLVFALSWRPDADPASIGRETSRWQEQQLGGRSPEVPPHENDREPGRRLRVGFVSPDFKDHCQAMFVIPLLEHRDRTAVEVFCYSSVRAPDAVTERIQGLADTFRDISRIDDDHAAQAIRGDRTDVLLDLSMHMGNNRIAIFASRPAPVQIAWLAYPGTTGLSAMDYRLTDPFLDPPGTDTRGWYTEASVHLPDSFWCYDPLTRVPEVGPLPAAGRGRITFGCLNSFGKTNAGVLATWARVLEAVPGSRMIVLAYPGESRARVLAAFARTGVDAGRVEFVSYQPRPEYLATYNHIDVALDTFPVNGHTTSLDAFWMGVPVVTMVGPTVLGRAGLQYAHHLGVTDLVATTPDGYVSVAAALARDLPRLERLRADLRARMEASPLMDAPRFARGFEAALRSMWTRWCDGLPGGARPGT